MFEIMDKKKIVIVGGVAGGATAAAHARRISEEAEIIIFERGEHVSFDNCGLPYFLGGEIPEKESLLVQTPIGLKERFNLDVRIKSEVVQVEPTHKKIKIRDLKNEKDYWEIYDDLILSTGAYPLKPPIPGIDRPGHFTVRNIPDVDQINQWISKNQINRVAIIGGGFIGLELAEQFYRRGFNISLIEASPQVMPPLDQDMAAWLHKEIGRNEINLYLSDAVVEFKSPNSPEECSASIVRLKSGVQIAADLVILGLGVRPESGLAKMAGLKIGEKGGIRVDNKLQTSEKNIWAIGDAIEVRDLVTNEWTLIPLAGPANRQGRIVAENIFGGSLNYPGTLGTAILRFFDLTVACTGANEKTLSKLKIPFKVVHLHPHSNANYYPGGHRLAMKVIFKPENGKLLGAQIVGKEGVDKRIDVLATALKANLSVHDLEDLELAYAPPFGSAKDPVNLAGMVAQHSVHQDIKVAQWYEIENLDKEKTILLDVRDEEEIKEGDIPGACHIPLPQLRGRMQELPKDHEIIVYCQTGQRSYFACRLLKQNGFQVRNLSGAYRTWKVATSGKNS